MIYFLKGWWRGTSCFINMSTVLTKLSALQKVLESLYADILNVHREAKPPPPQARHRCGSNLQ